MNFDPSWVFDSSLKFYVCADISTGQTVISCFVQSLSVWSTYFSTTSALIKHTLGFSRKLYSKTCLKVIAVLIGAYEMKEATGTTLADYTGNLADATFGKIS